MTKVRGLFTPLLFGLALSSTSLAQADTTPLLQDGKQTLYQRVLTTPECQMRETPDATERNPIPAFSRYYVYERLDNQGQQWLKVGPDARGNIAGWLDQACTVPWSMQLTLAFTNPANRNPVLFFEDADFVEKLVDAESPAAMLQPIYSRLNTDGRADGIVAKEPELAVDQREQFYLLPIFEAQELYTMAGEPLRLLRVASVSKPPESDTEQTEKESADAKISSLQAFNAAVVFVIDSTISMGPYIDRTRDAVRSITEKIEGAGLGDRIKFGLVSFRGNTDVVPELEYVAKMYVSPNEVESGEDFLEKVRDLREARVSTPSFSEDTYAGLSVALNDIDWSEFGARYIVLITDAGAITADDPLSTTGLDAAQVRLAAQEKGVAIYAMHLKTPAGLRNHPIAQAQYQELTFNSTLNKPLYYPVDAGSVQNFGRMVDALADSIADQVSLAYEGELAVGSARAAQTAADDDPVSEIQRDAQLLGYAMQLAYLGQKTGTEAPSVFEAWVLDRDLVNPSQASTEVRVLMTKDQLSDMSSAVQTIVDAANQSHISPSMMFEQLRSVAATMGRDPNQLAQGDQTRLVELGLLGEYLEGLPYRSDVLNLDEQTWASWSAAQQQRFIRNLSSKLVLYRSFNADVDRWVSLAPDAHAGDDVYPIPLEALP